MCESVRRSGHSECPGTLLRQKGLEPRVRETPARHHLLSNQAPLASPEGLCAWQHPLPRPAYQHAAAQQRRPPPSNRLLLTGLPSTADFLELLWLPGCLLFPTCCCCCCWHSACWRRPCSFSRASGLSLRFFIPLRCLSREGQAAEKGTLCPACPGHFPLAHSHHPAAGCFALVLPAAPSSCLSEAPKRDCANVFAAGTGSFHRWALFLYWNMRLWTTGPLEEQALLALSLPRPPLPLSTWQSLSLLRQQPLSQARNVTPSRQSGGILCFGQLLLKLLLKGDTRLGLAVAWTSAHAPAC